MLLETFAWHEYMHMIEFLYRTAVGSAPSICHPSASVASFLPTTTAHYGPIHSSGLLPFVIHRSGTANTAKPSPPRAKCRRYIFERNVSELDDIWKKNRVIYLHVWSVRLTILILLHLRLSAGLSFYVQLSVPKQVGCSSFPLFFPSKYRAAYWTCGSQKHWAGMGCRPVRTCSFRFGMTPNPSCFTWNNSVRFEI
jgi:hypothetical protein